MTDADVTGPVTTDADLAALAIEAGADVVSFDADFARFVGVRWLRPDQLTES